MYDATLDVYNFRREYSLGETDAIDCKSLLLRLNIITLFRQLSQDFSGMCIKSKDKKFMLINYDQCIGRQNFTIAHELYHLFVQQNFKPHICNPGVIKDTEENKADKFASCFLMPEMGIKSLIPTGELTSRNISIPTILKLEQYYQVSHTAMSIRLREIGVINEDRKKYLESLRITQTARLYGFDTSIYLSGNKDLNVGDYGVIAKEMYDKLKISESHYISLMELIGIDVTKQGDE